MKVKFIYLVFFFIAGIAHGKIGENIGNSTYAVVKVCKGLTHSKCKENILTTKKMLREKKYVLSDLNKIKNDELYLNIKNNGKGDIYYTYTNEFGIDQEWRSFNYNYKNNVLSLHLDKNAYIIDSLLKKDDSQPFLDRSPFSTISKEAKVVGSENKEQPLIYEENTNLLLEVRGNGLILRCIDYLKFNKNNSPITKLCGSSENVLFLDKIK